MATESIIQSRSAVRSGGGGSSHESSTRFFPIIKCRASAPRTGWLVDRHMGAPNTRRGDSENVQASPDAVCVPFIMLIYARQNRQRARLGTGTGWRVVIRERACMRIEVLVQRPGVTSVPRHELKIPSRQRRPPPDSESVGLRFAVRSLRSGALPCPPAQHETKIVCETLAGTWRQGGWHAQTITYEKCLARLTR
jgi:hypothetical protein